MKTEEKKSKENIELPKTTSEGVSGNPAIPEQSFNNKEKPKLDNKKVKSPKKVRRYPIYKKHYPAQFFDNDLVAIKVDLIKEHTMHKVAVGKTFDLPKDDLEVITKEYKKGEAHYFVCKLVKVL